MIEKLKNQKGNEIKQFKYRKQNDYDPKTKKIKDDSMNKKKEKRPREDFTPVYK